jgi:hypothetical protein
VNDESERIWKVYSGHYPGISLQGQENNRIDTSRNFTPVLTKFRTEHLQNTGLGIASRPTCCTTLSLLDAVRSLFLTSLYPSTPCYCSSSTRRLCSVGFVCLEVHTHATVLPLMSSRVILPCVAI